MHARQGTRNVLADLMEWHGTSDQVEAMTLALHHLHALGPKGAAPFFAPPRHEYVIPENVSKKLTRAYQRESLRICRDE